MVYGIVLPPLHGVQLWLKLKVRFANRKPHICAVTMGQSRVIQLSTAALQSDIVCIYIYMYTYTARRCVLPRDLQGRSRQFPADLFETSE